MSPIPAAPAARLPCPITAPPALVASAMAARYAADERSVVSGGLADGDIGAVDVAEVRAWGTAAVGAEVACTGAEVVISGLIVGVGAKAGGVAVGDGSTAVAGAAKPGPARRATARIAAPSRLPRCLLGGNRVRFICRSGHTLMAVRIDLTPWNMAATLSGVRKCLTCRAHPTTDNSANQSVQCYLWENCYKNAESFPHPAKRGLVLRPGRP